MPDVLGGALSSHLPRRPGPWPGTQHCQHVGRTRAQSLGHEAPTVSRVPLARVEGRETEVLLAVQCQLATSSSTRLPRLFPCLYNGYCAFFLISW